MKRVITLIIQRGWDGATVEVVDQRGDITSEIEASNVEYALREVGAVLDSEFEKEVKPRC